MPGTVRVAVFGNSFATKAQLPALRWAGGNTVIGIAGADRAKAESTAKAWAIPNATDDWHTLLALDPDLVIITTPVHLHAPMVRGVLETNAAILCEKPFALDAKEAAELTTAATGRLAVLDHQLRWSPWRRKLRELVREGVLGDLWTARVGLHFGSVKRLSLPFNWWFDGERGGGMLGAIGSHLLDLLQYDLGPVDSVRARLTTYVKEREDAEGVLRKVTADEHATLWLRMASGVEVTLDTNSMAAGEYDSLVEYTGSAGTLRLTEDEHLVLIPRGAEPRTIEVEEPPTQAELGMPELGPFARILPLYLRDLIGAVAEGATTLPGAATFADGLETMRVIDAARRSARDASWAPSTL